MRKIINLTLGVVALIVLPFWWSMFNAIGLRITFKEIFIEWFTHWKSGEAWGVFDK